VGRWDYEYVRNGTANLFMMVEPLGGRRQVKVTTWCTKMDFALPMKERVDVHDPEVEKSTLVMDNLNTHRMSCLYEAFAPDEVRRLIEKIEVVPTPKHGRWLNRAECELSVMEKQALGERVENETLLREGIAIWNADRNNRSPGIDWSSKTSDARIKTAAALPADYDVLTH
jgi:transposase